MSANPSINDVLDIKNVTIKQVLRNVTDVSNVAPMNRAARRAKKRGKLLLSKNEQAEVRRLAIQISVEKARAAREEAERIRINALPFSAPENQHKIAMVFDPVDAFLTELETTGEIRATEDGTPLLWAPHDGANYPIVPALESMCETYSKLARTYGWTDETDGMRKLAKRLELEMPLFKADVTAARATIAWMREQTLLISPDQFSRESLEVQIRDELRARV